jgi:hypothetical protein
LAKPLVMVKDQLMGELKVKVLDEHLEQHSVGSLVALLVGWLVV